MHAETRSALLHETQEERRRLLAHLERLTEPEWDTASLCAGWRVREVVAHLTMPQRLTPLGVAVGVARAGLSFNRYADRAARDVASGTDTAGLLADLRAHVTSAWTPPGGGQLGALSHEVIHGLDITEPLGLPGPPVDRVTVVLRGTTPRQVRYFGVALDEVTLTATDAPVTIGSGPSVRRLPASDLLLVVTGRRPVPARSRGDDRPV